jgi:hypothetical protein
MDAPLAMLHSRKATIRQVNSAMPCAPVVPERERRTHAPRTHRTRSVLATTLHHLADALAPAGGPESVRPAH